MPTGMNAYSIVWAGEEGFVRAAAIHILKKYFRYAWSARKEAEKNLEQIDQLIKVLVFEVARSTADGF